MTTIKTYAGIPLRFHGAKCPDGSDPVWDEGLGQNTCLSKPRAYAVDDVSKPPTEYEKASDALDKLAKERVASYPGTTYRTAFAHVLETNPELRAAYAGTK